MTAGDRSQRYGDPGAAIVTTAETCAGTEFEWTAFAYADPETETETDAGDRGSPLADRDASLRADVARWTLAAGEADAVAEVGDGRYRIGAGAESVTLRGERETSTLSSEPILPGRFSPTVPKRGGRSTFSEAVPVFDGNPPCRVEMDTGRGVRQGCPTVRPSAHCPSTSSTRRYAPLPSDRGSSPCTRTICPWARRP